MNEPLEAAGPGGDDLTDIIELPEVVHQAAGMTSVQLAIPIRNAYGRLAGYARQCGRPVEQIAADIVEWRLQWNGGRPPERRADATG
ncbi:ANTAR domain-containing protein [Actinomadura hibisca]|uniref:ANTAR domain-containing protein n=1 Tax=Actinomadura hibisca TaxID=68565 RepID=UPI0008296782|nr:ANTAR domain-containing protein [Actinomadura hibisca]